MATLDYVLPLKVNRPFPWQRFLLDSLLASVSTLLVTTIIFIWNLYPRIPNISIVYLLVVITLASTRGRYAAIFASLVAFVSFDFFIVPPIYTLTMYRPEEWIALFVFLFDAVLTGHLASTLRVRAQEASRRERETRILYDLVRTANAEEQPESQLLVITRAIVNIFSSWGVNDCSILQPDDTGTLRVQASAYQPAEKLTLSSDEMSVAAWVMLHGHVKSLYEQASAALSTSAAFVHRMVVSSTAKGRAASRLLQFIPLKVGQKTVGVLRLKIQIDPQQVKIEKYMQEGEYSSDTQSAFFWTFLDQAASLIERVRLQRENLRIEILQRTDALRAALLSSVSHDLRTPLASIKAAASSLLQVDVQWDDEARRSFARSIESEADRLNRLVGNLLDMSRIEDGAIKPEKELYDLSEVIHDVLGRMRSLLQNHPIQTYIPDDLPPVELDYLQIDQVLTNLIENAIRYTPVESPIEVSVERKKDEVVMRVADRGPGIPAADREHVFDKFYRVLGNARNPNYPTTGSGLGLAVCKGLVEAHGGRIWTEPREGGGAVFLVTLPILPTAQSVASAERGSL
ncbi:MAG TPA: hypothetical protein DHW02_19620 [Ktedonobacter sp.]|nr:hypothetical protein [Ktedonobacter sp.]